MWESRKYLKVRCYLLYSDIQMSLHNHENDNLLAQKNGSTDQNTECIQSHRLQTKRQKQALIKYIQYIYSNQIWTLYALLQEYPKYMFFFLRLILALSTCFEEQHCTQSLMGYKTIHLRIESYRQLGQAEARSFIVH